MNEALRTLFEIAGGFFLVVGLIALTIEMLRVSESLLVAAALFIIFGGVLTWFASTQKSVSTEKKKRK